MFLILFIENIPFIPYDRRSISFYMSIDSLVADDLLINFIERVSPLEVDGQRTRRSQLVSRIESLANDWMKRLSDHSVSSKLLPFGSSILGVVTNESDLDAVLLIPSNVTREMFFQDFVSCLRGASAEMDIQSIMAVPDAHVPVLKMVVGGLAVDILPCLIPPKQLRALVNSNIENGSSFDFSLVTMTDLDTPSLLALNGVRLGRLLIDSIKSGRIVSDEEQVEGGEDRLVKFRLCLRVVKFWAKRRGIYCNAMGFFGGVTWAILLVRHCVCVVPGTESPLIDVLSEKDLLARFFQSLHEQTWGASNPVLLRPLPPSIAQFITSIRVPSNTASGSSSPNDDDTDESLGSLWDPSMSEADRKSLMPVLTPMAPFMNSTFNVVSLTQKVLMDEFKRAAELTRNNWNPETVCQSALPELQAHYPTKLSIKLSSSSLEEKWLFMWEALIVSKLRVLLYHLERIPGLYCRPFPVAVPVGDSLVFSIFLAILPVNGQEKRLIDFNDAVAQFHGAVVAAMETRDDQVDLRNNCRLTVSLDKD